MKATAPIFHPLPGAPGLPRRDFLIRTGLSSVAVALGGGVGRRAMAGDGEVHLAPDHFIPVDKGLAPEWVAALFARGEPEWFSGRDLETIGMPVGGICAGQVYLTGDGRLAYWDVFNQNINTGYGAVNWKEGRLPEEKVQGFRLIHDSPVRQGFAIRVRRAGTTLVRALDQRGFPEVRFRGEYPVGRVEYADATCPVRVTLEAFSPFIPLNSVESALPATLLTYTLENVSSEPVDITLAGWLSNAVARHSAPDFAGRFERTAEGFQDRHLTGVRLGARAREAAPAIRPPKVFADFEGEDYGEWQVEGEAFGTGPARGTLPNQNPVSGFLGRGLVNTYLGGDRPHGRLTSPEFTIDRPFISFLIGGGSHAGQTCINLLVDGQVVRTATGKDNELLEPHNWEVTDLHGKTARIEIVDTASGGWGHINIDQIEFRDDPMSGAAGELHERADFGTLGLFAVAEPGAEAVPALGATEDWAGLFGENPATGAAPGQGGVVRVHRTLRPGHRETVRFVVTWHFPNLHRGHRRVGNHYARHFLDAVDVARHVAAGWDRLSRETRAWVAACYDSTLPWWLLDRLHSTAANLATTTCQWWENGRFWAWEGGGCCHGTCGHVWNYAHTLARLFPDLERSVREHQDFKDSVGMREDGSIGFRGEDWGLWAGDSQAGYVLKAFREHQCSPDNTFLQRNWRQIRRAMDFLLTQDGNDNGLIEGRQHQTYDQDYFGANTFVGALYLAALRAAESMARELGDLPYADRCHAAFESGRRLTMERLFNGEYFIQEVDLEQHPDWQYGDGCLADQLFGQSWAHQLGLGHLYPASAVRRALESIWKYCWAPDITRQNEAHPPERWFASKGDAGLFTCTWPRSRHYGPKSTRYRDELWTGIEYQVAANMAADGLLTEALAICRAIHERYHPRRFNPWNEIECGDHYARALASWSVLLALAGFDYHGPKGHLAFAPRITPDHFKSVFTAAEGWGSFEQRRAPGQQTDTLAVRWGRVRLATLGFELGDGQIAAAVRLEVAGRRVAATFTQEGTRCLLHLAEPLTLHAGQTLTVEWSCTTT